MKGDLKNTGSNEARLKRLEQFFFERSRMLKASILRQLIRGYGTELLVQ